MSSHDLSALWLSIERSGTLDAAAIRFLDTGVRFPTGPVLVGLDGMNQRHLCIPAISAELGREDKRSRGVTIEVRSLLDHEGRETPFVDIHCRKPELSTLFETLATEILTESQRKPDSPFLAVHSVLERWRELLEPSEGALLGPKQLAALLAELLLLERLGKNTAVPPVTFWLGPEKGPHDFVCGNIDFEVKSTLTTTRREVEIHTLSQLTESPGTTLYLWWTRLRLSPGRGTTVPETVARLLARGAETAKLMNKLKLEGYKQADVSEYRRIAFEVIDTALYVVDRGFPRLTAASFVGGLPAAVTRVDYIINLDSSGQMPLEQSVVNRILESVE